MSHKDYNPGLAGHPITFLSKIRITPGFFPQRARINSVIIFLSTVLFG